MAIPLLFPRTQPVSPTLADVEAGGALTRTSMTTEASSKKREVEASPQPVLHSAEPVGGDLEGYDAWVTTEDVSTGGGVFASGLFGAGASILFAPSSMGASLVGLGPSLGAMGTGIAVASYETVHGVLPKKAAERVWDATTLMAAPAGTALGALVGGTRESALRGAQAQLLIELALGTVMGLGRQPAHLPAAAAEGLPFSYRPNPVNAVRSPQEALHIARAHGVVIDEALVKVGFVRLNRADGALGTCTSKPGMPQSRSCVR